ncbi:zinc finger MYM-type protein 5-like [Microplitis demolitor]|uniref:zinc finger MYM-type protein 5-like n=1 Tax=Microplitis demolitor TaxID=69319 RepID=UPI00235B5CD2|nr:zinc finger MYM-type protein 5-like [Microplitis demolitor]
MSSFRKKLVVLRIVKKQQKNQQRGDLLKKIPKISTFMTTSSSNISNSNENKVQSSFSSAQILEETVQQETQGIQFDSPSINLPTSDLTRSKDYTIRTDPYLWEFNQVTRDFVAVNGTPQNINADFEKSRNVYSDKTRFCSTKLFKRIMKNGEVKPRAWLIYSETKVSVFCAPCLLFGNNNETNAFTGEGFRDWKNSKARVEGHENSHEISYWKKILHRVVAIVKSLSIRGLPFRGHSEQLGNPHNGNFLGTV